MAGEVNDPTYVSFPCYKMNARPRGICLIINNKTFSSPHGICPLPIRTGSDVDQAALAETFWRLQFKVECYEDLTDAELVRLLKEVSLRDHSRYDCFVCCVLSHGRVGQVYGSNGVGLDIACLAEQVKSQGCPSLNGKPRLFFIQACQGSGTQTGMPSLEADAVAELRWIPNESDFLFGFSTAPGFESYRDPESGSLYVRMLVKYLDKYAEEKEILEILTKVNYAVGEAMNCVLNHDGTESLYKHTPAPQYTLRKKLIFFPLSSATQDLGSNVQRRQHPARLVQPDCSGHPQSVVPMTGVAESSRQREISSAPGAGEARASAVTSGHGVNATWRRNDKGTPDPRTSDDVVCRHHQQKHRATTKW